MNENQQAIADFQVQDYDLSFDHDSNSATVEGNISASATVLGADGQPKEIGWDVTLEASCELEWESDESPSGWNYKTDSPTYTSYTYATGGNLKFTSLIFDETKSFYINNEDLTVEDAKQIIHPNVLKLLLDPKLYESTVGSYADKEIQEIEPPEPDFDEPDRYDYDSRY